MRIVIIGKLGQVSQALANAAPSFTDVDIKFLGRPEIDLTKSDGVAEQIAKQKPDIVINPAAYTAVDNAEANEDEAMQINAIAAGEIAKGAALANAFIIQLSTDYVFDGTSKSAYQETDETSPKSAYGRTKLAGEKSVQANNPKHIVARTAWVYSRYGNNFVKTMLRVGANNDLLKVVDDQVGCPTSADDLAHALFETAQKLYTCSTPEKAGVYHYAGSGAVSWCEFAREIFSVASEFGFDAPDVEAITTKQYPTPAARPQNSQLDCRKLKENFGIEMPEWKKSVRKVVIELMS